MKRLIVSALCLNLLVVIAATFADDRADKKHTQAADKEIIIPAGAIRIALPTIRQPDNYSCGAAAIMSICSYYGVGPATIEKFKRRLNSDEQNGTDYHDMAKYVRTLGLNADIETCMSVERLQELVGQGKPVICSVQAYCNRADFAKNDNGHYLVAIGFDAQNFYFMDPVIKHRRGFIPKDELPGRWHDNEAKVNETPKVIDHLGIVIYPKDGHTPYQLRAERIE